MPSLAGHQNGCNSTVSLHVAMSMLTNLAMALAHLKADDYAGMRHMRINLPGGRLTKTVAGPSKEMVAYWLMYQYNSRQLVA